MSQKKPVRVVIVGIMLIYAGVQLVPVLPIVGIMYAVHLLAPIPDKVPVMMTMMRNFAIFFAPPLAIGGIVGFYAGIQLIMYKPKARILSEAICWFYFFLSIIVVLHQVYIMPDFLKQTGMGKAFARGFGSEFMIGWMFFSFVMGALQIYVPLGIMLFLLRSETTREALGTRIEDKVKG